MTEWNGGVTGAAEFGTGDREDRMPGRPVHAGSKEELGRGSRGDVPGRIDAIRQAILNGTYHVSSAELAGCLMDRMLRSKRNAV